MAEQLSKELEVRDYTYKYDFQNIEVPNSGVMRGVLFNEKGK